MIDHQASAAEALDSGARTMPLVTGATGSNGSEVLKVLASKGVMLRAMVRDPGKPADPAKRSGVELAKGDFDDPASLSTALHEVDRAFLLTPSTERAEQQIRVIDVRDNAAAGLIGDGHYGRVYGLTGPEALTLF